MFRKNPANTTSNPVDSLKLIGFSQVDPKQNKADSKQDTSYDGRGEYDYLINIGIIGPSNSGKISLSAAFVGKKYNSVVNYELRDELRYLNDGALLVDGKRCKFKISTRNDERFRALTNNFEFRGKHLFFITFDLADRKSFEQLNSQIEMLQSGCVNGVQFLLVGTKLDKINSEEPVISDDEIIKLAKRFSDVQRPVRCIGVSKVSAAEGINIQETLHMAISEIILNLQKQKFEEKEKLEKRKEQSQSVVSTKADDKKIEPTEREVMDRIWKADSLSERNKLVCEWLSNKSNNLKDKEWGLIRTDSLKKLFSNVEKASSSLEKFNLLSNAIELALFNKHRKGMLGDTSTVSKIKRELEKYKRDAEIENAKSSALRR